MRSVSLPNWHRPRFPRRTVVSGAVVSLVVVAAAIALPLTSGRAAPAGGWNLVNSPSTNDGGDDILLGTTCANAQECWAVGADLPPQGNGASPIVQEWDGSSWSFVATPTTAGSGSAFFSVTCVTSSDCWSVGALLGATGNPAGPLAENWDGSSWSVVSTPDVVGAAGAVLQSVSCVSASDCWAVGDTTDAAGTGLGSIALHWDGTTWTVVPTAPTGQTDEQLNGVTCVAADNCWAVGAAGPNQENPNFLPIFPGAVGDQGIIEHWDGASWTLVPSFAASPPDGGWVSSVMCVSADDCWAAGATTGDTGSQSGPLMQQWDGSTWSVVPTPAAPTGNGILSSVTCLSADQCWASGSSGNIGGGGNTVANPLIDEWNGSIWSIQPSPSVTALAFLTAITCARGDACWSVGSAVVNVGTNQAGFNPLVEQMVLPPDGTQASWPPRPTAGSTASERSPSSAPWVAPPGPTRRRDRRHPGRRRLLGGGGRRRHLLLRGRQLLRVDGRPSLERPGGGHGEDPRRPGLLGGGGRRRHLLLRGRRLLRLDGRHPPQQAHRGHGAAPDGRGYWEVASDGGIFAFGSAAFYGSMGGASLGKPIVGMVATPNGRGYWEVAADGGVFAFGNATFEGSVPGQGIRTTVPVVGMTATPSGGGYWLVGADGSTYTYGDAIFLGSLAGIRLAAPVVGASS